MVPSTSVAGCATPQQNIQMLLAGEGGFILPTTPQPPPLPPLLPELRHTQPTQEEKAGNDAEAQRNTDALIAFDGGLLYPLRA